MLINGQGYAHADLQLGLLGNFNVAGFKAISYSTTRQKQNSHGAQGRPVERTRSQINYEGSITLTLKEVKRIREANGKRSLTEIPPFPVTVSYANGVDAVTVDKLLYVEFTADPVTSSIGDTEIPVELPIVIGDILYNQ
mgnify:CR=1 FL=1